TDLAELLEDLSLARVINLRENRDLLRTRKIIEPLVDEAVARPDLLIGRHAERDEVDVPQGRLDQGVEALAEQRARPVHTRRVDDDELAAGAVNDATNGASSGLRFRACDGNLLADERVRERRFADVRAADKAHEAGAKWFAHDASSGAIVASSPV